MSKTTTHQCFNGRPHIWVESSDQTDVGKIGVRKNCINCSMKLTFVKDKL